MRRREFIALMSASVAWPFAALAQQAGADLSRRRLVPLSARLDPFCMRCSTSFGERGFIEGQNLTVD